MLRVTVLATPLLVIACGAPAEPPATAPLEAADTSGAASGYPSAGPSAGPATYPMPSGGAATSGHPAVRVPRYPTPTLPTVTPSPTRPRPSPAPMCTQGPSAAQVIAVVRDRPGIPADPKLDVKRGPFCAGRWQFTVLGEAGKTLDEVEPLLVVTTGRPSALTVVEAGADVCSDHVEHAAPSGIRVLACGS